MKYLLFPLLLLAGIPLISKAQAPTEAKKNKPYPALLSGTDESTITTAKVIAMPSIEMRDKNVQVDSFDFSWVVKTGNDQELMGPYHNEGNQLSAACLMAFKNDADKGGVSRIFVEEVNAKDALGQKVYFKVGCAFLVKK